MSELSNSPSIEELLQSFDEEFESKHQPATVAQLARLYGVIAAQQEAFIAMFAFVMRANPQMVISPEREELHRAITILTNHFAAQAVRLHEETEVDDGE